jgi:tetratricopeptide (TPR) repeat protein
MSLSTLNTSIVIIGMALSLCATAMGQAPDQWGQKPNPEAVKKMEDAIKLREKDLTKSELLLKQVLEMEPNYYRAQYNLGLVNLAQNKKKEAVEEMEKAKAIQEKFERKDPSIYTDLGRAYAQAGMTKKAKEAFETGARQIKQLEPGDQERLLQHGITFFIGEQNPAAALQLFDRVRTDMDPALKPKIEDFLNKAVARLKANDVQEGWVSYMQQAESPTGRKIKNQFFTLVDGGKEIPKIGQKIKTNETVVHTVVYIRDRQYQPENVESPLGKPLGFARIGETFTVVGDPVAVKVPEKPDTAQESLADQRESTAWWVKVKRDKSP